MGALGADPLRRCGRAEQLETDNLTVQDELGESQAELRELREQLTSAGRLACWLYEHGGQEVLDGQRRWGHQRVASADSTRR